MQTGWKAAIKLQPGGVGPGGPSGGVDPDGPSKDVNPDGPDKDVDPDGPNEDVDPDESKERPDRLLSSNRFTRGHGLRVSKRVGAWSVPSWYTHDPNRARAESGRGLNRE